MKRPLVRVTLCYVAGILLPQGFVPLTVLFGVGFALLAATLVWDRARPFLLAALLVVAGWINLSQRNAILSPHDLRRLVQQDEIASVRGLLRETPRIHLRNGTDDTATSWTAEIEVKEISLNGRSWEPAFGRVATTTPGAAPESLFAGQSVEITDGILGPPPRPLAEGLFDYAAYLGNLGVHHELRVRTAESWQVASSPTRPPLTDRFSAWARKTLARGLPIEDETLRLEWALTLGWKAALTDQVSEPFIKAATYHIFAVDGLRIAIVSGILIGLLRVMRLPRIWCGLLAIPLVCFYAAMTGWPPSAFRAIVMVTVVFGSWALERPPELLNSLAVAAFFLLILEPQAIFQAGFQLSFVVVLCLILVVPHFEELGKWLFRPDPFLPKELRPHWQKIVTPPGLVLTNLFLTSVAAWLGSIPLVARYFHILTPVSGPANVLAVPLCGLVLICNLSSLLLGAWFPPAAELFNHAGWFCMKGIEVTSAWSARWPGAYRYVSTPSALTIALYYALLLGALTGWLFRKQWRAAKIAGIGLLAVAWCAQWLHNRPVTQLTVLPLEGGHAIYLRTRGHGNDWLIDCGNLRSVESITKPFLRAQGVNRLPNFLLTHGEAGYSGGAESLVELFHPAAIYTGPVEFRSTTYREFERDLHAAPQWRNPLKLGDSAGPWTVLHPAADGHLSRAEDNTLVLRGEFDGTRVLLLSDLGRPGQRALLERTNDLRADLVVAGVPSEDEPLGDMLLDAIQPRAIILAGGQHPAPRVAGRKLRERLAARNVTVIYESESGAVTIEIRPGGWKLRAMDGRIFSGQPQVWKQ